MRTQPEREGAIERFWHVMVPRWLQPWAPRAADAVADGAWTAAWPWVGAAAPLAGIVVGALLARSDALRTAHIYTQSIAFLAVIVVLAFLHGAAAVAAMGGFIVLDVISAWSGLERLFRGAFRDLPWIAQAARLYGSLLVGYLLLTMLVVRAPLFARRAADGVPINRVVRPQAAAAVRAVLYGIVCGVLVWLWCQAMIVLARPAFTWLKDAPYVAAILPVQTRWPLLVVLAAVAGAGRILLEEIALSRAPRRDLVRRLAVERSRDAAAVPLPPATGRVTVQAAVTTLLLAGAFTTALDGLIVFVLTGLLAAWAYGVAGRPALMWAGIVQRVPAVVRLIAALALGYWLAGTLVARLWATQTFRPVLFGGLAVMAVFYLLSPQIGLPSGGAGRREPA
ncbi:MAG: hypothetical protein QN114_05925 [Armatimonadota bacterium]|nr:hypothetical protein [Armatimonadota bacterium]